MKCDCEKYEHLEPQRKSIDKRIKETPKIKQLLKCVAEQDDNKIAGLYRCPVCNQLWQETFAWNWGAKHYIYKVPEIDIESWRKEPFIKPDELLIHMALYERFEEGQTFVEKETECRREDCSDKAIQYSVLCKWHQFETISKFPEGKIFEPYGKR
jgi:hypothetical protein